MSYFSISKRLPMTTPPFRGMNIIIILMIFVCSVLADEENPQISLSMSSVGRFIECTIKEPTENSIVHMKCPLVGGNSFCYENCRMTCTSESNCNFELFKNIKCDRTSDQPLTYRYTLTSSSSQFQGIWQCHYRGSKSTVVKLLEQDSNPIPDVSKMTPNITQPTIIPYEDKKSQVVTPDNSQRRESQSDQPKIPLNPGDTVDKTWRPRREENSFFMMGITRTDLVITILSLLAISLLVNVAFCIRCILVRRYMDAQKMGETGLTCLERCLCVSRGTGRRGSGLYKSDAYGRPECIYEDPNTILGRQSRCQSSVRTSHLDLLDTPMGPMPPIAGAPAHNGGGMPRSRTFPVHHQLVSVQEGPGGETIYLPATLVNHGGSGGPGVIYAVPARRAGSATVLRGTGGSQILYDEVPGEHNFMHHPPTLLRQSSSTGSLYRGRRLISPTAIEGPLHEEVTQFVPSSADSAGGDNDLDRDDNTSMSSELTEDCTKNTKRLELSKQMLQKADTLLREAGNLLQE